MFGTGALLFFLIFSVDVLGLKAAPLAFVPFSFCSTAIYYSGEFKQYSGDLFFSVFILFVTFRIFKGHYKKLWIIIFTVVGVICVWFSNTSVIMLAGAIIALFLNEIKQKDTQYFVALSVALLIISAHFIALYFLQMRQAIPKGAFSYWQFSFPTLNLFSTESLLWWYEKIKGYALYPLGFQDYGVWFSLLALSAGVGVLFFDKTNRLLFHSLMLPIMFLVILSTLHLYPIATGKYDIHSRLILFTIPIAFTFIAIGLNRFAKIFPFYLPALVLLGTLLVYPAINHMIPWPNYMKEEMKPLLTFLKKNVSQNDVIYVYANSIPAFQFYTRNEPIPCVKGTTNNHEKLSKELEELPRGKKVWFVSSHINVEHLKTIIGQFESLNNVVSFKKFPGSCWLLLSIPEKIENRS